MTVDLIGSIKGRVEEFFTSYASSLTGCQFSDIRIDVSDTRWASAEDGKPKAAGRDEGGSFGIRVIAGESSMSPGYYGRIFSLRDVSRFEELIKEGLDHAYTRAVANSRYKAKLISKIEGLEGILCGTEIAPIKVHRDTIPAVYKIAPETVTPQEILALSEDASKRVKELSGIQFNDVTVYTQSLGKLFIST
ncbi:MAG: hypothetical protein V3T96_02840, partial [Thermodesulfobacteriota bacterium]